jgi:hypothetical protein
VPEKVKPVHKQGYLRSGQILFNNINQINVADQETPKAKPSPKRETVKQETRSIDIKHIHSELQSQLRNYESPIK